MVNIFQMTQKLQSIYRTIVIVDLYRELGTGAISFNIYLTVSIYK